LVIVQHSSHHDMYSAIYGTGVTKRSSTVCTCFLTLSYIYLLKCGSFRE